MLRRSLRAASATKFVKYIDKLVASELNYAESKDEKIDFDAIRDTVLVRLRFGTIPLEEAICRVTRRSYDRKRMLKVRVSGEIRERYTDAIGNPYAILDCGDEDDPQLVAVHLGHLRNDSSADLLRVEDKVTVYAGMPTKNPQCLYAIAFEREKDLLLKGKVL